MPLCIVYSEYITISTASTSSMLAHLMERCIHIHVVVVWRGALFVVINQIVECNYEKWNFT